MGAKQVTAQASSKEVSDNVDAPRYPIGSPKRAPVARKSAAKWTPPLRQEDRDSSTQSASNKSAQSTSSVIVLSDDSVTGNDDDSDSGSDSIPHKAPESHTSSSRTSGTPAPGVRISGTPTPGPHTSTVPTDASIALFDSESSTSEPGLQNAYWSNINTLTASQARIAQHQACVREHETNISTLRQEISTAEAESKAAQNTIWTNCDNATREATSTVINTHRSEGEDIAAAIEARTKALHEAAEHSSRLTTAAREEVAALGDALAIEVKGLTERVQEAEGKKKAEDMRAHHSMRELEGARKRKLELEREGGFELHRALSRGVEGRSKRRRIG